MGERRTVNGRRIYDLCGRVHRGPVCINGGDKEQAICLWCGDDVTSADRAQIQRTWDTVRDMLSRYKDKEAKR